MSTFWHGFADMHVIAENEVVMASGEGALITDSNGRDYIDATAALWNCNVGFGRREIADAVADQLTRLHGYSSFGAYTTKATERLFDQRRHEPVLAGAVDRLQGAPLVGEVRAVGLTAAVALAPDVLAGDPGAPEKVVAAALRHGVATRVLRAHAIHISPPFVITEAQIDAMVDGIGNALEDAAKVAA
jgi:adenosylmethionine-8-amino-7-oxononanoate aminotransferase